MRLARAWLAALLFAFSAGVAQAAPPNIVLIVGDDVGWMDYGFMGAETVETPNLDRLAAGGTVFTRAFSTDSVCRPALRTLLTGLYPDAVDALYKRRSRRHLPPAPFREVVETLPAKLAERGYASFQGGKHWEGTFEDAGFTDGMTRTLSPPPGPDGEPQERDLSWASGSEGLALGRETMQPLWTFLEAHREGPFFVWYAPMLPHLPFDAPPEFARRYADAKASGFVRAYWANLTRFDATVGALLAHLEKLGLRENTLVVYVADNGWDSQGAPSLLGGEKGKGSMNEIGVRTPLVFSWPGHVAAGVRDDRLVSIADVYPTLLQFAGVEPAGVPGSSLYPLLTGTGDFHREFVIGGSGRRGVAGRFLRTSTWRFVTLEDGSESLYLIERDPREENDLAAEHPELVDALRMELVRQLSEEMAVSVSRREKR